MPDLPDFGRFENGVSDFDGAMNGGDNVLWADQRAATHVVVNAPLRVFSLGQGKNGSFALKTMNVKENSFKNYGQKVVNRVYSGFSVLFEEKTTCVMTE